MKIVYVILLCLTISCAAKIKKKSLKSTITDTAATPRPSAIIAIEIVDPNENSTSKNSKRTIDNALGYGYNNFDKPRYEVYKYSQHDIPPYKGDPKKLFIHSKDVTPTIQKSVQYTLPTITEYYHKNQNTAALKPGTTLYSSLTSKGQIGGLRSSLSQISELESNSNPVPVIVLRIYPDQLKDSSIHANLPAGHPFAKAINSLNIQSLLNHYVKALKVSAASQTEQVYSSVAHNTQQQYHDPQYITNIEQPQQQYQPEYQQDQSYPDQNNYYQDYSNGIQVQEAPIKYQFQYQAAHKQAPEPQYYYLPGSSTQSINSEQYYQPESQHYLPNEQQYQNNYYSEEQQQKLLTYENYPSNKHTRVIFKTDAGNVRTPESEESVRNREIKTIKIQIPENIAKVEVQESERPFYGYNEQDYQQEGESQEYYTPSPELYVTSSRKPNQNEETQYSNRQNYYHAQEKPAYDFHNIDYNQVNKNLLRRGAANNYYYHESKESDDNQKSSEEIMAAYEEAAFPSTTAKPNSHQKVKSKKRQ